MRYQRDEDAHPTGGRMVDLSEHAAAFLVADDSDVQPGERVFVRLTHPMVSGGLFTIQDVRRYAKVLRVDTHDDRQRRVAVGFTPPLDYNPVGDAVPVHGNATIL